MVGSLSVPIPAQSGTLSGAMPARKPDLLSIDKAAKLIGRNQATIYRWFRRGLLTRHYEHDFEVGVRRAAVDMHELREKMPRLLGESIAEARPPRPPRSRPDPASAAGRARTDDGRPVLVAAIIPHPDGRPEVLMTGRRFGDQPILSWPGGHVREGEDPAAAVLREIGEELEVTGAHVAGLLVEVDTHIDVSQFWGHRFRHGYRSYHYQVAIASPEVRLVDHEELSGVEWIDVDQVAEEVAPLPEELAAIAVRCARQAVAEHVRPAAE